MRIRALLFLAGLMLVAVAACTSGESVVVVPSDGLGTLSGSVTIGPLCPVQPCSAEIGDTYSSRQVLLQSNGPAGPWVFLHHERTFLPQAPNGPSLV